MSGTATVRAELGEKLREALPGFAVFPAPQALDLIEKPTLQLVRTAVARLPQAPLGAWLNTFTLIVIVPQHADEDALDAALEEVIEALDTAHVAWSNATRNTFGDGPSAEPCYDLTLNAHSVRKD